MTDSVQMKSYIPILIQKDYTTKNNILKDCMLNNNTTHDILPNYTPVHIQKDCTTQNNILMDCATQKNIFKDCTLEKKKIINGK